MERESNIQETSKSMGLEARLGLMALNTAVSGFTTYGVMDQVSKGNYTGTALIGLFNVSSVIFAYYHGKKAVEDYKK